MISIVINVKNGERYLHQCLQALTRFKEVVLLDNHSTDATITIAKQYANVKIFTSDFLGMGKVRNLAVSFATNDWIFFVDCDEVLTPELVDYLVDVKDLDKNTIYKIRRINYYNNYHLESSAWENDWILRLFNRKSTRFVENEVHDSFEMNNLSIGHIRAGKMYHFPYENVNGLIDKMQFYSSLYAKQFFTKKRPRLFTIPLRAFFMFLKCYILKRGFMDGYEGLLVSSYNAIGVFSKYIKLYELYYNKYITLVLKVTDITLLNGIVGHINHQLRLPNKVLFIVKPQDYSSFKLAISGRVMVNYQILSEDNEDNEDNEDIMKQYLVNKMDNEYVVLLNNVAQLASCKLVKRMHSRIVKQIDGCFDYQVLES